VASSTTGFAGDACFAEEGYGLVELGPEVRFEGTKLPVSGDKTTTETVRREFIRADEVRSFRVPSDVLADGLKVAAFPSLVRHRLYVGGSTDFALLDRPEAK
jgi:hypothetical protein